MFRFSNLSPGTVRGERDLDGDRDIGGRRDNMKTEPKTKRDPDNLKGKHVWFFRMAKTRNGLRRGRVVRVDWTKRGGLRSLTVILSSGHKVKALSEELFMTNQPTGVEWYGRVVHLSDWLDIGCPRHMKGITR